MSKDIQMPKLSDTMEEGKLLKWFKVVGDHVDKGEKIFEVETDKADMEVEAFDSGTMSEILLGEGHTAPVGATIARLAAAGEATAVSEQPQIGEERPTVPAAHPEVSERHAAQVAPAAGPEEVREEPVMPAAHFSGQGEPSAERAAGSPEHFDAQKVLASPLARRIADELGVDLTKVSGTGPGGRITREDVERSAGVPGKRAEPVAAVPGEVEVEELSSMRKAIAKTVIKSKAEIPHFYVTVAADMTQAVSLKKSLETTAQFAGRHLTYTHLIIKAVVESLKKFPSLNWFYDEGKIRKNKEINIGVVVAVKDGLLIPVIKNCESLSLPEIAEKENALVEKARSGRLAAGDLTGGTFTISNVGMLDVESFAAIIYPPQSAILAVASIKDTPVVKDDRITAAKVMRMTISVDHRILDGTIAASFLDDCKRLLENPATLVS